jgi:hypothetical protein
MFSDNHPSCLTDGTRDVTCPTGTDVTHKIRLPKFLKYEDFLTCFPVRFLTFTCYIRHTIDITFRVVVFCVTAPCYGPPDVYQCYCCHAAYTGRNGSHKWRRTRWPPNGSSTHPEHNSKGGNVMYLLPSLILSCRLYPVRYFRSFSVFLPSLFIFHF